MEIIKSFDSNMEELYLQRNGKNKENMLAFVKSEGKFCIFFLKNSFFRE